GPGAHRLVAGSPAVPAGRPPELLAEVQAGGRARLWPDASGARPGGSSARTRRDRPFRMSATSAEHRWVKSYLSHKRAVFVGVERGRAMCSMSHGWGVDLWSQGLFRERVNAGIPCRGGG